MAEDRKKSRTPAPADKDTRPAVSARPEIDAFLTQARSLGPRTDGKRGRLVFALDATMSRQPTWDLACKLQAEMFEETAAIGGLDVQLVFYRGISECAASAWVSNPARLGLAHGEDRLPRRPYPDRPRAVACAQGEQARAGGCLRVRGRRDGGEGRRSLRASRASSACSAFPLSCSRRTAIRSPSRRSARSRG